MKRSAYDLVPRAVAEKAAASKWGTCAAILEHILYNADACNADVEGSDWSQIKKREFVSRLELNDWEWFSDLAKFRDGDHYIDTLAFLRALQKELEAQAIHDTIPL